VAFNRRSKSLHEKTTPRPGMGEETGKTNLATEPNVRGVPSPLSTSKTSKKHLEAGKRAIKGEDPKVFVLKVHVIERNLHFDKASGKRSIESGR